MTHYNSFIAGSIRAANDLRSIGARFGEEGGRGEEAKKERGEEGEGFVSVLVGPTKGFSKETTQRRRSSGFFFALKSLLLGVISGFLGDGKVE